MQLPIGHVQQYFGHGLLEIPANAHAALIGATGTGKSTQLLRLIVTHIRAGHGVTVIDPHGELVDEILRFIPKARSNAVLILDPTNDDSIPAINPLSGPDKTKALQETLKIVSTIWADAWGPQSDFIARNFGEAVIECEPAPTLLHIYKAFMVTEYRKSIRTRVRSANLRLFFDKYEEDWDKRQKEQASAPPANKFDSFLQPMIRDVIGQTKGLDFGALMNEGKIVLCRFAKGRLGPEAGAFLASLVTSQILFAALARERGQRRVPHYVFIDEFHNCTRGNSYEQLLSETRKYGVFLTIADQTIDQLPEGSEYAIFGNVASLIVGRVGARDSERLAKELGLREPKTLLGLMSHRWYVKTQRQGYVTDALLIQGLPPVEPAGDESRLSALITRSSKNHGASRQAIEERLNRFLSN